MYYIVSITGHSKVKVLCDIPAKILWETTEPTYTICLIEIHNENNPPFYKETFEGFKTMDIALAEAKKRFSKYNPIYKH